MNKLVRLVPFSLALVAPLLPCSEAAAQSAGLTLDPDAQLEDSNHILVSGTVPCTYLGQTFDISANVTQGGNGQGRVYASGYSYVTCSVQYGQQPFSVVVASYDGQLQKGKAHVFAWAYTCDYVCYRYDAADDVHVSE